MIFHDRVEAGRLLAKELQAYKGDPDAFILGLPRGGVPVAYEVAKQLGLDWDIFLVRKLGVPGEEELAMGAIASHDVIYLNESIVAHLRLASSDIEAVIQREKQELKRRELKYRGKNPFPDLSRKKIILIDDGIATGATMRAAILALKSQSPAQIILAVPVAPVETLSEIKPLVDQLVCLHEAETFYGVGAFYDIFPQTTDEEVCALLQTRLSRN